MRISDWSSDVCSSELVDRRDIALVQHLVAVLEPADVEDDGDRQQQAQHPLFEAGAEAEADEAVGHHQHDDGTHQGRKSVVWGKSVSVRVDLGGCRISKKKLKIADKDHKTTIHN